MSDLELLGYLEQPHTSAGRVPSAAAYRYYVDSLAKPDALAPNDVALINSWFRERVHSIDDIFQSTAKILSRMSKNVSVVLANKDSESVFPTCASCLSTSTRPSCASWPMMGGWTTV